MKEPERGRKMNRIINQLVFNDEYNMIDKLKRENVPIIVYGAGSYARDVLKYLSVNRVYPKYVLADDVSDEFLLSYNLERIHYDEITFPCIVIMGFAMYLKGNELKAENPFIKKVFYPSLMPYDGMDSYSRESIISSERELQEAYELLDDDMSRKCMVAFLNAQINDDASYCFPCYEGDQTYFDNSVFKSQSDENYLDIGAYTGDTIRLFSKTVKKPKGHIWAIEVDKALEVQINSAIQECGVEEITDTFITGLWDELKTIYYNKTSGNNEEGYLSESQSSDFVAIKVNTLDNLMNGRTEKVSLMKINFLHADRVIKGGVNVISEDRPKLAITVGFGKNMIIDIPKLIKSLDLNYRVFFRFNSPMPAKLVCYAI